MSARRSAALLAATAIGLSLAASQGPSAADPPGNLGTNLAGITYYDGAAIFNDLVQQSSAWVPQQQGQPWGQGRPLDLDAEGWPTRLADGQSGTLVLADATYPAGSYTVSWQGSGAFTIAGKRFGGRDGSGTVALDGESMVLLELQSTEPADPLRHIAVRIPGAADGAIFNSVYLQHLAPYRVLRFMDWQRTNSTFADGMRTFRCADRVTAGHYSQGTERGAAVETMVDLANITGKDPWFTIPHEASPDWIRCHARVVADRLNPGLLPRYEFSNETWNPAFRAYHDLTDEAVALGLGDGDPFAGLQHLVARRHNAAMDLVAEEMAAAGRPFRRVMSGQAANVWVLEQRLTEPGALQRTDEIAIAPYLGVDGDPFDPAQATSIAAWSPDELRAHLTQQQSAAVDGWVADHVDLARRTGKALVAYESGQHLAGDPGNDRLTELFTQFNRSAAMGGLYRTYLSRWHESTDNALLMHFTDIGPYTRYGSWGAVEAGTDPGSSPKYTELARYAGVPAPEPAVPDSAQPGIRLAGGARFTRTRRVDVEVRWPSGATTVTMSNDRAFGTSLRFNRGQRVTWRLPRAARSRVYARFETTGERTFSDAIVLDSARPRVLKIRAQRIGNARVRATSSVRDPGSGVASVQVCRHRGCTPMTFSAHPRIVVVRAQPRIRAVHLRFADRAGNWTAWQRVRVH